MRRFMEELGISRATVTRDFEYLRDLLGAPIIYARDRNGHYYDPDAEAFELPGFWLNQSELYALLAIEHLLESVQPGFLSPYIGPLKGRVRKLLGESGQGADNLSNRIRILGTGRRSVDTDGFSRIAEAVLAARKLTFQYHSRSRDVTDRREHELLHRLVADADVVICTALVPGRPAPELVTEEMVAAMRRGSVIVDLAAEAGGNCALTEPGAEIERHHVRILGPLNAPSAVPFHASQMYARNVSSLLLHLVQDGSVQIDLDDEITKACCITHAGEIVHPAARELVGAGD
jgi:hypothetical protein